MKVEDVMTRDVKVIFEDTSYKAIVDLLDEAGVSGLPVIDHRRPVGIVSESDLLLKSLRRPPRRYLRAVRRGECRKAQAVRARELMTSPAIVVGANAPLRMAAGMMLEHHIRRLPVVDEAGHLVGIVTRSDLLKEYERADQDIRDEVERDVLGRTLLLPQGQVRVSVESGVVTLRGQVCHQSELRAMRGLVAGIDGVISVVIEVEVAGEPEQARVSHHSLHDWIG